MIIWFIAGFFGALAGVWFALWIRKQKEIAQLNRMWEKGV